MAETKEARAKRLARNKEKMKIVKADQIGVCRFVAACVQMFVEDTPGKYVRCGSHTVYGLQYENKLILPDGSFKYLNCSSVKIVTVYEGIPEWANDYLKGLHFDHFFYDKPVIPKQKGGEAHAW